MSTATHAQFRAAICAATLLAIGVGGGAVGPGGIGGGIGITPLYAGTLNPHGIPAEAVALLHCDFEAGEKSPITKAAQEFALTAFNLAELQTERTGIGDPGEFFDVTVGIFGDLGALRTKQDAIAVFRGKFDPEKIFTDAQKSGFKTTTIQRYTFIEITDKSGKNPGLKFYLSPFGTKTLVALTHLERAPAAIAAHRGDADSIALPAAFDAFRKQFGDAPFFSGYIRGEARKAEKKEGLMTPGWSILLHPEETFLLLADDPSGNANGNANANADEDADENTGGNAGGNAGGHVRLRVASRYATDIEAAHAEGGARDLFRLLRMTLSSLDASASAKVTTANPEPTKPQSPDIVEAPKPDADKADVSKTDVGKADVSPAEAANKPSEATSAATETGKPEADKAKEGDTPKEAVVPKEAIVPKEAAAAVFKRTLSATLERVFTLIKFSSELRTFNISLDYPAVEFQDFLQKAAALRKADKPPKAKK